MEKGGGIEARRGPANLDSWHRAICQHADVIVDAFQGGASILVVHVKTLRGNARVQHQSLSCADSKHKVMLEASCFDTQPPSVNRRKVVSGFDSQTLSLSLSLTPGYTTVLCEV